MSDTTTSEVTVPLANWVEQLTFDTIPERVRTRAKHLLLDGVACGLVGAQLPWSRVATKSVLGLEGAGEVRPVAFEIVARPHGAEHGGLQPGKRKLEALVQHRAGEGKASGIALGCEPLDRGVPRNGHGADFEGDSAAALTGLPFTAKWSGKTIGDLFELINKDMPNDDPGSLTRPPPGGCAAGARTRRPSPASPSASSSTR